MQLVKHFTLNIRFIVVLTKKSNCRKMIRIETYYLLAILINILLLFHSSTSHTLFQRPSKRNEGSYYVLDKPDQPLHSQNVRIPRNRRNVEENHGLPLNDTIIQHENVTSDGRIVKNCQNENGNCSGKQIVFWNNHFKMWNFSILLYNSY